VTYASTAATFAITLETDADCSKSCECCALLLVFVSEFSEVLVGYLVIAL
jgi:hypothetical protein